MHLLKFVQLLGCISILGVPLFLLYVLIEGDAYKTRDTQLRFA